MLAALVAWLWKSRIVISKLARVTYVDMISFHLYAFQFMSDIILKTLCNEYEKKNKRNVLS
jgi:hypothetical protein